MSKSRALAFTAVVLLVLGHSALADRVRVTWRDGRTAELGESAMAKYRVASVPVEYRKEARGKKLSGKGMFDAQIDRSGKVTAVHIRQSTGSKSLDQAAIRALRQFRYKPGVFTSVTEPVTFHHFGDVKLRF
ncbi:MAG TPA: energy transducer TonB [Chthoniobacterales bacterium]|nr:energy transducer TonB [Chthoniobacterales bacterium]